MTNPPDQGWGTTVPGFEPFGGMVVNAVEAYERTLTVVQNWFEGILATYKEQAEGYGAMLRSVDTSLRALEQVVESQAKITQALSESLDASRGSSLRPRTRISTARSVSRPLSETRWRMLTGQLQALKNQVDMGQAMLSDPMSTSSTTFLKMTKDWSDAYGRMLGSANPFKPTAHED